MNRFRFRKLPILATLLATLMTAGVAPVPADARELPRAAAPHGKHTPGPAASPRHPAEGTSLTHWSPQRKLGDRATSSSPALAEKDGVLSMAWAGIDLRQANPKLYGLWASTSKDGGKTWAAQEQLGVPGPHGGSFAADNGPSLTVIDGKFVMAWEGSGDMIYVSSSSDGRSWSPQRLLFSSHGGGVSLAATGGMAVMAFGGNGTNVYVSTSKDGAHWLPPTQLGDRASTSPPSVAAGNGEIVMAWRGLTEDNIWVSTSRDGIQWTPQHELSDRATPTTPGLAYSHRLGVFYMAWEGLVPPFGGFSNIWVSYSKDGLSWSPQVELHDRSTRSQPGLGTAGGTLYMAWRGGGLFDANIWTSFLER